ncbi:hypothetical protein B296_00018620 [Ensete ventricosum]|uniref:Uncharacterized protein n=1 Tax=Ensete ventricosum TaxID=4639 RepID=A0A426ZZ99_ENSVE|nr:hypothetical protein B296_00018620 [Ensete ventricosum]
MTNSGTGAEEATAARPGQVVKVKRKLLVACMTCPICHKLLRDATTISECLHTCESTPAPLPFASTSWVPYPSDPLKLRSVAFFGGTTFASLLVLHIGTKQASEKAGSLVSLKVSNTFPLWHEASLSHALVASSGVCVVSCLPLCFHDEAGEKIAGFLMQYIAFSLASFGFR